MCLTTGQKVMSCSRSAVNGTLNESFTGNFLFTVEWEDQRVPRPEILRLIYQGRFIAGNVTLGSKLPPTCN